MPLPERRQIMTRRYFQCNFVVPDIPVLMATITARATAVPFAVVVGGRSPRKAHGQRKALTVATTTIREALLIVQDALIVGAVLVAIALNPALLHGQQSPRELFERARIVEEANQDLMQAIRLYEQAAAQAKGDRALAAQALLRAAESYQKLGNSQAASVYERLVREYSDQREVAATARTRVAALRAPGVPDGKMSMRQVYSGEMIDGTVSPDGRWVSFTDWSTRGVAVRDLAAGTKRVLTRPPDASNSYPEGSVISPDGRQVAYLWTELPQVEFQVRIVPMDGEAAPRIVHRSPNYLFVRGWTPDGRNLLVTRSLEDKTWQIALLSVQDGSIKQLKSLRWAKIGTSISPDGRYIAYDAPAGDGEGKARDIFVLAADGSQEAAIVQHPASDHSTIWSPDGLRILFVSDRTATPSLWSVPVKDGKPAGEVELVKSDIGTIEPLTMTRTGTFYYSVPGRARRNVYRAALGDDGKVSGTPEVVTDKYVNSNWGASLSPDGKQLAYYSDRPDPVLVIRDLSSHQERVFPLNLEIRGLFFNGPGWLPDGRSVLVAGRENQRQGSFLYRADLASGKAEEVGRGDVVTGFKASPDGKYVFYQGGASQQLARFDLETRQTTILRQVPLPQSSAFASPAVSRDGNRVAFVQITLHGNLQLQEQEIFVTNAAGGEVRAVFRYPQGQPNAFNTLAWTPDDRHILFTRHEQSNESIWRVPVDGGVAERIGVSMNAEIKGPQMHPDGRSVFFTAVGANTDQIWALENFLPVASSR
jgi:Tol biopolymer transport system component